MEGFPFIPLFGDDRRDGKSFPMLLLLRPLGGEKGIFPGPTRWFCPAFFSSVWWTDDWGAGVWRTEFVAGWFAAVVLYFPLVAGLSGGLSGAYAGSWSSRRDSRTGVRCSLACCCSSFCCSHFRAAILCYPIWNFSAAAVEEEVFKLVVGLALGCWLGDTDNYLGCFGCHYRCRCRRRHRHRHRFLSLVGGGGAEASFYFVDISFCWHIWSRSLSCW